MTRLLVLWLLAERPLTGYEIKKALADDGMRFWFELQDGSIYSALRTLTKHGDTEIVGTERDGKRPARTRYRITTRGKQRYEALLLHALRTPTLPIAPIDVALSARGDLAPTAVSEALAGRSKSLHELRTQIDHHRAAAPVGAVADRNRTLVQAELDWLARLDQRTIT